MLTAINTTKGLFVYNRMPFGISAAPGIFQRTMERLIQGIPMTDLTVVYLDDVLVTGRTPEEHHSHLKQVLERLQKAGLRLKREKCSFGRPSCTYLGHRIDDGEGIHPTEEKVSAIINAPAPRNVAELRSFLGLVNYYHRFIQNLSTVLAPLYELLQKGNRWVWGRRQEMAFEESKQLLGSTQVLVHYDSRLPLILSCDALPYGVGAVLSHRMKDGSEKPVGFATNPWGQEHCRWQRKSMPTLKRRHLRLYSEWSDFTSIFMGESSYSKRTTNHDWAFSKRAN